MFRMLELGCSLLCGLNLNFKVSDQIIIFNPLCSHNWIYPCLSSSHNFSECHPNLIDLFPTGVIKLV